MYEHSNSSVLIVDDIWSIWLYKHYKTLNRVIAYVHGQESELFQRHGKGVYLERRYSAALDVKSSLR